MNRAGPFRLTLVTEDSVSFSVQPASPVLRAFAVGIDLMVLFGAMSLLQLALILFKILGDDVYDALLLVAGFLFYLGYFMLMEWGWQGQTLGKKIMGLRVMDASARRLTPSQVVIRNLFRMLDMFPIFYAVGGVASLFSRRFQRLGDHAADTLVVRTHLHAHPAVRNLQDVKYNTLRDHPRLESALRRKFGPHEAALLARALLRREELDPAGRVRLYGELADFARGALPSAPEVLDGLGDEALLRNCVDSLYRHRREM